VQQLIPRQFIESPIDFHPAQLLIGEV
jgi:hypothetical protein